MFEGWLSSKRVIFHFFLEIRISWRVIMMNETYRRPLIAILAIGVVLILIFGSGTMSGAMMSGWITGQERIGGYTFMWVPTLLAVGVGLLLGWLLFGRKR
jgi:hypothetical protein